MKKAKRDCDNLLKKQKATMNLSQCTTKSALNRSLKGPKIKKTSHDNPTTAYNSVKKKSVTDKVLVRSNAINNQCIPNGTIKKEHSKLNKSKKLKPNPFNNLKKQTKDLTKDLISSTKNFPPPKRKQNNEDCTDSKGMLLPKHTAQINRVKYKTAKGFLDVSRPSSLSVNSLDNTSEILSRTALSSFKR